MGLREIALDTETTGLDPYAGHRIVEIGCVELIDHMPTDNHFHVYLNPERPMPKEAENVHGLSIEFLRDKPLFHTIADSLRSFLADSPLVIHNAAFDMKFINAEFERIGYPTYPMSQSIDTVIMARKKFPGQPANLDALCRRFNIDLSARVKHGALLDAELLADVYLELKGGRQAKMALESEKPKASQSNVSGGAASAQTTLPVRDFPPSDDELRAHKQFMTKVKDALWQSA